MMQTLPTAAVYFPYDKDKREKEIMDNLRKELEALTKKRRQDEKQHEKQQKNKGGDVVAEYLEEMEDTAKSLEVKVADFKGPHFTKLYRTLNATVAELQIKLDAIVVTGRQEIRLKRKHILDKLNELTSQLNKKIHEDGKHCSECEIQKI